MVFLAWGMWLGFSPAAQGCATCFGASDSDLARGMNMGIMSLLGVLGLVLASVVSFFGYLAWRARGRGEPSEGGGTVEWETT